MKEYLIKWAGYKKRTWEPEQNLDNCKEILNSYIMEKKKNNNRINSPNKINNNNKNKAKNNSPIKEKKSPYINYSPDSPDDEDNYDISRDEEYVCEDDKSPSRSNSKSKRKLRKRNRIHNNTNKKYANNINNFAMNNPTMNNNTMNINGNNNNGKKAYEDVDIDILDGNESPFSNKTNMNTKHEFYSDSSFEPLNNIENYYNTKFKNNLEKKRKRSTDTFSDISISIEDPIMKTENTSQNCSNANHIDFLGISQISIPKNDKEKISLLYKLKNNNKKVTFKGTSNNNNIPKEEIIKYYEKILVNYLGGKTINFQ